MKKIPEVTLQDWLDAEREMSKPQVQPTGSVSVPQYAEMRGVSPARSRAILFNLYQAGKAKREQWRNGQGIRYVYWLNK